MRALPIYFLVVLSCGLEQFFTRHVLRNVAFIYIVVEL